MSKQDTSTANSAQDEKLIDVSDFARTEYGLSAATQNAMLHYGHALLAIAATDGKVSAKEMQWLVSHQRKFGAPDEVIAQYHTFNPRGADLKALLADSVTDVPTWNAAPSIIYHAIQMCSADGTYAAKERASVQRAAKTLGIPDDVVLTLHALVEMETATAQMRKALFHTHTI
jgi:uncharacterized tellurite resistance protein B-like protein